MHLVTNLATTSSHACLPVVNPLQVTAACEAELCGEQELTGSALSALTTRLQTLMALADSVAIPAPQPSSRNIQARIALPAVLPPPAAAVQVRLLSMLLATLRMLTKAVRMGRLALCGPYMDRIVCALSRQQKQLRAFHRELAREEAERLCLGYLKVGLDLLFYTQYHTLHIMMLLALGMWIR